MATQDQTTKILVRFDPTPFYRLRRITETLWDMLDMRDRTDNRIRTAPGELLVLDGTNDSIRTIIKNLRNAAKDNLKQAAPELYVWVESDEACGVGAETLSRLIGVTGHPLVAQPHRWTKEPPDDHDCDSNACGNGRHLVAGEPFVRTLRQWWQYCGFGDPNRRRESGMSQEDALAMGNQKAKVMAWNLAESCVKKTGSGNQPRSPFRNDYDIARADAEDKVHDRVCRNTKRWPQKPNGCATRDHPEWGEPGSPWRDGHKAAHAHRITTKAILRRIYEVAWEAAQ